MHHLPFDVGDGLLVLVIAGLIAPLAAGRGLSPVLAFLVMGLIVGPFGLGRFAEDAPWLAWLTIQNVEEAAGLAEIGVALLLFLIGLEISTRRLWEMRRLVFGLGAAQIGLAGLACGLIAAAFGNTLAAAFVVGAAFALSSTAIVLQILTDSARIGGPTGRASLAILLMQDLAVVPILVLIQLLSGPSDQALGPALLKAAATAVVAIAVIMVIGRVAARPFLRLVASSGGGDLLLAAVLLLIVATGAATAMAGLSLAMGAFLAGLLLAETEYRHDIEVTIAPFKTLFLGLFFLSVGMGVDLGRALADWGWVSVSLVGMLAIKGAVIYGLARAFGVAKPAAAETAILLAPAGEFAFVIIKAAETSILNADTAAFMAVVAGASMVLTPILAGPARSLARHLEMRSGDGDAPAEEADGLEGHIIVVGYGRVGRLLGDILSEERFAHVALDADAALVSERRAESGGVYFGDGRKIDILKRLDARTASALVITMDAPAAAEAVAAAARREFPHLLIYARARDAAHARRMLAAGADHVVPEAMEGGLELAETLLRGLGVSDQASRGLVEARRRQELDAIAEGLDRGRGG